MFSACKTKEYSLKKSTFDNRLLFQELANIEIRTVAWLVLLQSNSFSKFRHNSQLNLNDFLVADFCTKDFSEIYLVCLLSQ